MNQWFERHVQTLVGSLGRLWQQPFATMLTIVVIGVALALPACLHVLVQNVRVASAGAEPPPLPSIVIERAGSPP